MKNNFLKTKKTSLLLLVTMLFFLWAFFDYKKHPFACGGLKIPEKCENYFEYLNSQFKGILLLFEIIGINIGYVIRQFLSSL
ncbi:MAG: hypothetical protein ABIJ43_03435 [Candidatus Beckwithbacteria bacterium]